MAHARPRSPARWLLAALGLCGPPLPAALAGVPLELEPGADPTWASAAQLAGFELRPCVGSPCARLRGDTLELTRADGGVERLPAAALGPEAALAVALSRLTLEGGPEASAPDVRPAPTPAQSAPPPSPASVRASSPPAATAPAPPPALAAVVPPDPSPPRPGPAESVTAAAPSAPPSRPEPSHAEPVYIDASANRSLERPAPFAPPPPTHWASGALSLSHSGQLNAQLGREQGAAWWGLGGRLTGSSVTLDLGAGWTASPGRWDWRLGGWAGLEMRPEVCLLCQVEESEQDGVTTTTISSTLGLEAGPPGRSPVARAQVELLLPLRPKLALAPRAGVAWSAWGLRPELGLGLIRRAR